MVLKASESLLSLIIGFNVKFFETINLNDLKRLISGLCVADEGAFKDACLKNCSIFLDNIKMLWSANPYSKAWPSMDCWASRIQFFSSKIYLTYGLFK